jgi:hypothetical protein
MRVCSRPEPVCPTLSRVVLPPEARQQIEEEKLALGAAQAPQSLDAASAATVERSIDEAFVSGYREVMLVAATIAFASAISAAFLIEGDRPKEKPTDEVEKPLAA